MCTQWIWTCSVLFFNDTATTGIYTYRHTLSLPDARPIFGLEPVVIFLRRGRAGVEEMGEADDLPQQLEELRLPVFERVAAHLDQIGRDLGRAAAIGRASCRERGCQYV